MTYEIVAKATGNGYTLQFTLGPYMREPPTQLLDAVREVVEEKFPDWTDGHKPRTVVVTSAPITGAGTRATG